MPLTHEDKDTQEEMQEEQDNRVWFKINDSFSFREDGEKFDKLPPGVYTASEDMFGNMFFVITDYDKETSLLSLEDTKLTLVKKEIDNFWDKRRIFEKNNLPFKRGILLYGPPGTGKSSLLKQMMREVVAKDGIVLFYNALLPFAIQNIKTTNKESPLIVIIEDIDTVHRNKDLLDLLDGHNPVDGVVFVATTNYIEKLPDTIKNRPSRFDRRILVGSPGVQVRRQYLEFVTKNSEAKYDLDKWARDTEGLTFAHLKELYLAVEVFECDYEETVNRLVGMLPTDVVILSKFDLAYAEDVPQPPAILRMALTAAPVLEYVDDEDGPELAEDSCNCEDCVGGATKAVN